MALAGMIRRVVVVVSGLAATLAAAQCSGEVTSVTQTGNGKSWYTPVSTADGILTNSDRAYTLTNIPSYLLGGKHTAPGAYPEGTGWSITISYTGPVHLAVWYLDGQDAGIQFEANGWVPWSRGSMQREGTTSPTSALLYGKYFASGTSVTLSGLNGRFIGGVFSQCDTATSTSTTMTTTVATTITSTSTSTTTVTTITSDGSTSSTTATTTASTVTTTTTITTKTTTETTVTATTTTVSTTSTTTETTRTSTSSFTPTTTQHEVKIFGGRLFLEVNEPDDLLSEFRGNPQVEQALKDNIAASLSGVESDMITILGLSHSQRRRLGGARRLAGAIAVDYEIRIATTAATAASLTTASILGAEADIGTNVAAGLTAAAPSITVSSLSMSEPMVVTQMSDVTSTSTSTSTMTTTSTATTTTTTGLATEEDAALQGLPLMILVIGCAIIGIVVCTVAALRIARCAGASNAKGDAKDAKADVKPDVEEVSV
mmetsp:Transcript_33848/g.86734  ORF Transcript_33848/g.86734 Transcript_33848/m.86734 type:complete len:487 (-) Transcript_33848:819-2279(-)